MCWLMQRYECENNMYDKNCNSIRIKKLLQSGEELSQQDLEFMVLSYCESVRNIDVRPCKGWKEAIVKFMCNFYRIEWWVDLNAMDVKFKQPKRVDKESGGVDGQYDYFRKN